MSEQITEDDILEFQNNFSFYDLPFNDKEAGLKRFVLLNLPTEIKKQIKRWGVDDSVVRDEVFTFLVLNQFNCSVNEFYNKKLNTIEVLFNRDKLTKVDKKVYFYSFNGGVLNKEIFDPSIKLESISISAPFILTPYSSEIDTTKRVDFLKDL